MRRTWMAALLLAGALGCGVIVGGPGYGHGRPRVVVPAGVQLELIAGTGVQYVVQPGVDVFLHDGVWFKFDAGVWFRAAAYGGPYVRIAAPPAAFTKIPAGHAKGHVVHGRGRGRGRRR